MEKKPSDKTAPDTKTSEMAASYEPLIDMMTALIEHRSYDDVGHVRRIRQYTLVLLKSIYKNKNSKYKLKKEDIALYAQASTFHDIGKIAVPDHVLLKTGRLTDEERELMKLHSIRGAEIIEGLKNVFDSDYIKVCADICRSHHERWDGSGYPMQLSGEQIPFAARVVAIADVYDALTSVKPYKPRLPHKTAVEMITNGECGMFDPEILDCFKLVKSTFEKISISHFGRF